ncbi:hypothetical protein EIN_437130 [Entamoeba invadens IP1]|uniref:Uncharacterized protein n=1 Tax=Entamoeba invadens IP1 TaxID=370355 RepID=A0A0A1U3I5_ENTIV|nr:hypothetical protein EIN_437130 [Entamoeba invadens IP1]ELP88783.1 hypothetical protein EIN_437130 [Entamoeba invadens IP1]|eukprot:XP_004255554.1 hypothetical protein EIN_437130 [Entamoeba invadens IP1]
MYDKFATLNRISFYHKIVGGNSNKLFKEENIFFEKGELFIRGDANSKTIKQIIEKTATHRVVHCYYANSQSVWKLPKSVTEYLLTTTNITNHDTIKYNVDVKYVQTMKLHEVYKN